MLHLSSKATAVVNLLRDPRRPLLRQLKPRSITLRRSRMSRSVTIILLRKRRFPKKRRKKSEESVV